MIKQEQLDNLKMEKNQKLIILGISLVIPITFFGFFKAYFGRFPTFENVANVTHVHVIAFILSIAILIWQPILIIQKKYATHRKIGKFTIVLAPILYITILLMVHHQLSFYIPDQPNEFVRINMLGGLISGTSFIAYYTIAMLNRKNLRWHVAFIIAATLVLLIPGLGRLTTNMIDGSLGLLSMIIIPYLILISILIYEKIKLKRNIFKSPYALIVTMQIIGISIFLTISSSEFWGSIVRNLAEKY